MKLIHNPNFPDGTVVISKDTYKKFIGNLKFSSKCVFYNNNLPPGTAVVSTDIFNELKGE